MTAAAIPGPSLSASSSASGQSDGYSATGDFTVTSSGSRSKAGAESFDPVTLAMIGGFLLAAFYIWRR